MGTHQHFNYKSVPELIYDTAYRGTDAMPINQLADELNVSKESLYRQLNPYDDKANFPAKLLNNLMRIKGDFSILNSLANRNGFILVKAPVGSYKKGDEQRMITEFQYICTQVVKQLLDHFHGEPTGTQTKNLIIDLNRTLKHTATIRAYVSKNSKQMDLFE